MNEAASGVPLPAAAKGCRFRILLSRAYFISLRISFRCVFHSTAYFFLLRISFYCACPLAAHSHAKRTDKAFFTGKPAAFRRILCKVISASKAVPVFTYAKIGGSAKEFPPAFFSVFHRLYCRVWHQMFLCRCTFQNSGMTLIWI